MTQLVPDCTTQLEYYVMSDSAFCVLSDQSTVIGVSIADNNTIIKQSITGSSESIVTYTTEMERVYTLGVDERQIVLFAGGSDRYFNGQVVQYDLSSGQVIKSFGRLEIGSVMSSIKVNNLWFFGGFRSFKFAVIDSVSRLVLGEPVNSALLMIYSMATYKIQQSDNCPQKLLFTFGSNAFYSEYQTDVFDITALVTRHSNLSNKKI